MGRRRRGCVVMTGKGKRAAVALALVAGVMGYGVGAVGSASSRQSGSSWPATVRCGAMAEDSAGHVRLVVFDRRADGSVRLVYRCERGGY